MNGYGAHLVSQGNRIEGHFIAGRPTGTAIVTYPGGSQYTGTLRDGTPSGRGILQQINGDRYEGDFLDGKQSGSGAYRWANGDNYTGGFVDGLASGRGKLTYITGVILDGIWQKGRLIQEYEDRRVSRVPLMRDGAGALAVPVEINGVFSLNFIVDSGATDVTIPADVFLTLMRSGTIQDADFLGKQIYVLADGSSAPSETFRIRRIKVGDREVRDVTASIVGAAGSLLLGQSFLKRFKSWSIDNEQGVLTLE